MLICLVAAKRTSRNKSILVLLAHSELFDSDFC